MLSIQELQDRLENNQKIITALLPYSNRPIKDLPVQIKKTILSLPIGRDVTSSGLELVSKLLNRIYISNYYLEKAIADPQGFEKQYSAKSSSPESLNTIISKSQSKNIPISTPPSIGSTLQKPSSQTSTSSKNKITKPNSKNTLLQSKKKLISTAKLGIMPISKPRTIIQPPPSSNIEL